MSHTSSKLLLALGRQQIVGVENAFLLVCTQPQCPLSLETNFPNIHIHPEKSLSEIIHFHPEHICPALATRLTCTGKPEDHASPHPQTLHHAYDPVLL